MIPHESILLKGIARRDCRTNSRLDRHLGVADSRLMAHFGHCGVGRKGSLLDVKRTIARAGGMSQVDPKQTCRIIVASAPAARRNQAAR